jgi:hypothetical protein
MGRDCGIMLIVVLSIEDSRRETGQHMLEYQT